MKRLKQKALLLLCVLTCFFAMTACGGGNGVPALSDSQSSSLQEGAKNTLEKVMETVDSQGESAVIQYRDNGMEAVAAGMESYLSAKDELGAYESVESGTAEETDSGYSIVLRVKFAERYCEFAITTDEKTNITSMSFNPIYTTGENMTKAALNTVMGMGTVFLVLIFISWLISCFRYIRQYEDKMKQKRTPAAVPVVERKAPAPVPAPAVDLTDDLELVAVITAAIAASTGSSADGLVVRSIRRAPGSKWKKA